MTIDRFDELLGYLLDDEIAPAQLQELVELAQHDESRTEELRRQLELAELLSQYEHPLRDDETFLQALEVRTSAETDQGRFVRSVVDRVRQYGRVRSPSRARGPVTSFGTVVVTAIVTAAIVMAINHRPRPVEPLPEQVASDEPITVPMTEPSDDGVAVVTRAIRVLDANGERLLPGDTVSPGRIRLKTGLVQLGFYCGATIVLEGPADFEVVSSERAICHAGKLRAVVPEPAQGFTILSPSVETVDLGTEFALDVSETGETSVHVFDGKVELYDPNSKRAPQSRRELTTGQGLLVGLKGPNRSIPADDVRFVSLGRMDVLAREERDRRFDWWRKFSEDLREDARVVAYYSFQNSQAARSYRTLPDDSNNDPSVNGTIIGCTWATGRWPGRRALEFKRPGDRVRVRIPGEFQAVTLAAWVRVDGIARPFNTLLLTDGYDAREPHWQIDRAGRLVLGVHHAAAKPYNYTSEPIINLKRLGQWIHLVTVYDGPRGRISHFLDGKQIHEETLQERTVLQFGRAEIGNWGVPVREGSMAIRNFNGKMDELIILREPLSAAEIENLYQVGRP